MALVDLKRFIVSGCEWRTGENIHAGPEQLRGRDLDLDGCWSETARALHLHRRLKRAPRQDTLLGASQAGSTRDWPDQGQIFPKHWAWVVDLQVARGSWG